MQISFHGRINMEQHLVAIETGFSLSYTDNGPCFSGWHTTSGNGNRYQLRAQLSYSYPNEKPRLSIVTPKVLYKHGSFDTLNDIGSSHTFHIYGTDNDGNIDVCHTLYWDASKTCVGVILKGFLWCEAYDHYLKTGLSIDDILSNSTHENREQIDLTFTSLIGQNFFNNLTLGFPLTTNLHKRDNGSPLKPQIRFNYDGTLNLFKLHKIDQ